MHITLADMAEDLGKIEEAGNKAVLVNNGHGFNIQAICPDMIRSPEVPREDEISFQRSEDTTKSSMEVKVVSEICLETLVGWIKNYFFPWEVETDLTMIMIIWRKDSLVARYK